MDKMPASDNSPAEENGGKQSPLAQSDEQVLSEVSRRSRRGFLVSGVAAAAGYGFWRWLQQQPQADGLSAPLRKALEFNGRVGRALFNRNSLAPEYDLSRAVPEFRRNGDIGLAEIDPAMWRLQLVGAANPRSFSQYNPDVTSWTYGLDSGDDSSNSGDSSNSADTSDSSDNGSDAPDTKSGKAKTSGSKTGDAKPRAGSKPGAPPKVHEAGAKGAATEPKPEAVTPGPAAMPGLLLTMDDIRKLPHVEMVTEFKCVEGWSEIVHWGGARLRDFVAAYPPPGGDGRPVDLAAGNEMAQYVGFDTPDGEYYTGIEPEAALHPQSLLAYELNGKLLTADHGAPLRLVTPLKYGIKQLKQIGRITYSEARPHDYWHEQGYDYYVGH